MTNKVEEIDLETAQMIVKAAEEKHMKEFLSRYDELCKEFGLQIVPVSKLEVRKYE